MPTAIVTRGPAFPKQSWRRRVVEIAEGDRATGAEIDWLFVKPILDLRETFDKPPTFVYAITEGDDGPFKVGASRTPVKRLRQMQIGNSRDLKIERLAFGGFTVERMILDRWNEHRVRGEWIDGAVRREVFRAIYETARRQAQRLCKPIDVESDPDWAARLAERVI